MSGAYLSTGGERTVKQWLGIYQGVVVNNADPLNQQRVITQVPQIFGTAFSAWASPLVPIGVAGPPVGTQVIVMFLGGDPDQPVYINRVSSATDWTLPDLVIGSTLTQTGTLSVLGALGTSPASVFTGGISTDTLTTGTASVTNTLTVTNGITGNLIGNVTGNTTAMLSSGTAATWQSVGLFSAWNSVSGRVATKYRMVSFGAGKEVEIIGSAQANNDWGAGKVLFQLSSSPVNYVPSTTQSCGMRNITSTSGTMFPGAVDTSGNVSVQAAVNNVQVIDFHFFICLDA